MSKKIKVGVVGYSLSKFNTDEATEKLEKILNALIVKYTDQNLELVSGYTNIGIPKIAYEIAHRMGIETVGYSARKALEQECGLYPVDKSFIVGENFGDESQSFIDYIDILIRIGGGRQSLHEVALFKNKNLGKDLENLLFEEEILS